MDGLGRERRQADGQVLGPVRLRGVVLHPFAPVGDHRLTRPHVEDAAGVADAEHPLQHAGELVELGRLAGLDSDGIHWVAWPKRKNAASASSTPASRTAL